MPISYRKNELEEKMLMNVHKKNWSYGLQLEKASVRAVENEKLISVFNLCNLNHPHHNIANVAFRSVVQQVSARGINHDRRTIENSTRWEKRS